jgi:hypothetical protein
MPLGSRILLVLALGLPIAGAGGSAVGDWGHFLTFSPTILFNNPEGRPFTISVHTMRWAVPDWNPAQLTVRLTGPDGSIVIEGSREIVDSTVTLEVNEAAKGVYKLHSVGSTGSWPNVWFESSLPHAVVWTGDPGTNLRNAEDPIADPDTGRLRDRLYYEKHGPVVFQATVPRRWWFWVPADITEFSCEALRDPWHMSQREDWGFFIISPRGQRIQALWGQPENRSHASGGYLQRQRVRVEVEPGAGGRFWCLEVSNGDSHNYSKINLTFEGVPPFLARSPEEWFDPRSGNRPEVTVYDDTPFMQSSPIEGELSFQDLHDKANDPGFQWTPALREMVRRWPGLEHWSPCPSLGDADGIQVIGDARFAIWNPDDRSLRFRIGTYIPRKGLRPNDEPEHASVSMTRADGVTVFQKKLPIRHIHEAKSSGPTDTIATGNGVVFVSVADADRWFSFTYPATPLVLIGEDRGGWSRFRFTASAPRNWYFLVPRGVRSFSVRFAADFDTDVLDLDVCAPDRTQARLFGNRGEHEVSVPEGLDGKIWYLRPSIGGATRIVSKGTSAPRYQDMPITLALKGVPGYLAPTWEQWFDPEDPKPAGTRVN